MALKIWITARAEPFSSSSIPLPEPVAFFTTALRPNSALNATHVGSKQIYTMNPQPLRLCSFELQKSSGVLL